MLTQEELKNYHTGFELFDPFGKGRMRELIYDYRLQQLRDTSEIETLRAQFLEQGRTVDRLVKMKIEPIEKYKDQISLLEGDLRYANLTIDSLTKWSERLEELLRENGIRIPGDTSKMEERA